MCISVCAGMCVFTSLVLGKLLKQFLINFHPGIFTVYWFVVELYRILKTSVLVEVVGSYILYLIFVAYGSFIIFIVNLCSLCWLSFFPAEFSFCIHFRPTTCWGLHCYRDKNLPRESKNWRRFVDIEDLFGLFLAHLLICYIVSAARIRLVLNCLLVRLNPAVEVFNLYNVLLHTLCLGLSEFKNFIQLRNVTAQPKNKQ